MSVLQWFRPPRHLLVLFLGTTLAVVAALGWIGWRSFQETDAQERQIARERLKDATDVIVAAIGGKLADIDVQLDRFATIPAAGLEAAATRYVAELGSDEIIVAVFEPQSVRAFPPRRLLFYPVLPVADDPYVHAFMPDRAARERGQPVIDVSEYLREMASSDDPQVRAEGLFALADRDVRAGHRDAALAAYGVVRDPAVLIGGRPAELVARLRRCELLKQLGRQAELLAEARRLDEDLHRGRWQLTGPAFAHYADEIERWLGSPAGAAVEMMTSRALADAVNALWGEWVQAREHGESYVVRASRLFRERSVFVAARATADRAVVLVGGPRFLQQRIVEPLRTELLDGQDVRVGLLDGDGRTVLASGTIDDASAESNTATMDQTRLPWMVRAVSVNPQSDKAQLAMRQRFLIAGLALLALTVVTGTYFSARAMTRELHAARLQSEFVAAVSHEFRTPLTLLRQFSDLLADGRVSNDEERQMYYAALQRGTRRLTRLVEDLLDFARMESGSHVFRRTSVVAREWLTRVVEEFDQECRTKGYRVELAWNGATGVVVHADEAAIARALWNLLDNAVKYSPDCRTVWVSGSVENETLTVAVRDRGLGIAMAEQRAIFGKFIRGAAAQDNVVKGTGLGLALVEQIVEAHGGTVQLRSSVGEGSTFAIQLPVQADDGEASRGPSEESAVRASG